MNPEKMDVHVFSYLLGKAALDLYLDKAKHTIKTHSVCVH